jgi:hypothetical protein
LGKGDAWFKSFDENDVAKLNNIESLLRNYIKDIERRESYKKEIPDSRRMKDIETRKDYKKEIPDSRRIKDIETRESYKNEIPDSRQWLLDYALEYALLMWAEKKSVEVGWMPWSSKRPRDSDLGVLLERLGLTVGVS